MKHPNIKNIISTGIIIAIINYSSSFSNYLFHLISSRILTIDSFGQLQSLINLNTIVGMLTGSIGPSIILFFSKVKNNYLKSSLVHIEKKIFYISAAVFFFLSISYLPLKFLLKIQPAIYLLWIIQVIASIFYLFYLSVFQSKLKLIIFALSGLFFSILKNVFSILFALTSIKAYGPYLSPALSTIISAVLLKVIIINLWPSNKKTTIKTTASFSAWKYSISTLLTNTFLIFIISQDIFIVRYYFSETISGIYSSAAIIGKIILYTVSPITVYLFPVFIKYQNNSKILKKTFYLSTISIIILTTITSGIYRFYPDIIIKILMGSKFTESVAILPAYATFISLYSVIFHVCQFLLSQKSPLSYKIPVSIFLVQSGLLFFFHQNLNQIVIMSTLSIAIGIILLPSSVFLRQLYHRFLGRSIGG